MNDEVKVGEVAIDVANDQAVSVQSDQIEAIQASAGEQLAALREARGWSVELVASQLNLAPRQIHALETDDYAALPGLVIVRGFIRAYAKLLRVDAAPILAAVAPSTATTDILPVRPVLSASFSESSLPFARRGRWSLPLVIGVVLVLTALLFFGAQRMGWLQGVMPGEQASSTQSEGTLIKELPAEAVVVDEPVQSELTADEQAPVSLTSTVIGQSTAGTVAGDEMPVGNAAPTVVQDTAASSADASPLVFVVREDSWVEIRRADNSILVSRIFKAGSTESFHVTGPVSLIIGNAAGVGVTLRGQALEIPVGGNNVARLSVK